MTYIFCKLLFWFYIISDFKYFDDLTKYNFIYNFVKMEAIKMQYMDVDEVIYTNHIINYVREIYKEYKATSKEDVYYVYMYRENFPEGEFPYYKNMIIAREFLNFCDYQMRLGGHEEKIWGNVKLETRRLHDIYDLLDDINRTGSLYRKRQKASKLRLLMGDHDFENKIIPFYLPVHLFTKIE